MNRTALLILSLFVLLIGIVACTMPTDQTAPTPTQTAPTPTASPASSPYPTDQSYGGKRDITIDGQPVLIEYEVWNNIERDGEIFNKYNVWVQSKLLFGVSRSLTTTIEIKEKVSTGELYDVVVRLREIMLILIRTSQGETIGEVLLDNPGRINLNPQETGLPSELLKRLLNSPYSFNAPSVMGNYWVGFSAELDAQTITELLEWTDSIRKAVR